MAVAPERRRRTPIYEGSRIPQPIPSVRLVPEELRRTDDILEVNFGPNHPSTHGVLRLVVELDGETVETVVPIWPTADWQEREVWDMMGIRFAGHPALSRILMDEDWEGHPLRKDYPIGGEPVRFSGEE